MKIVSEAAMNALKTYAISAKTEHLRDHAEGYAFALGYSQAVADAAVDSGLGDVKNVARAAVLLALTTEFKTQFDILRRRPTEADTAGDDWTFV